jgi:hypothetical protein
MEIRFVSSLTAEHENFIAPGLLKAISAILDQLPIAYTVRIETTGAQVFQHTNAGPEERTKTAAFETASAGFAGSLPTFVPRANGQQHRS